MQGPWNAIRLQCYPISSQAIRLFTHFLFTASPSVCSQPVAMRPYLLLRLLVPLRRGTQQLKGGETANGTKYIPRKLSPSFRLFPYLIFNYLFSFACHTRKCVFRKLSCRRCVYVICISVDLLVNLREFFDG